MFAAAPGQDPLLPGMPRLPILYDPQYIMLSDYRNRSAVNRFICHIVPVDIRPLEFLFLHNPQHRGDDKQYTE